MTLPPFPPAVAEAFARFPDPVRSGLLDIRAMIFSLAEEIECVGPLTETLKWGEPAYLTEASGSGTTIRLGTVRSAPENCAVLFNCRTTLVETFRAHFPDVFRFDGNRAIIVPNSAPMPEAPLAFCLRTALAYHHRPRK